MVVDGDVQDRDDGKWHVYDDVSVEPWDVADLDKDCFGGRYVSETTNKARLHPPPLHPAQRASKAGTAPSAGSGILPTKIGHRHHPAHWATAALTGRSRAYRRRKVLRLISGSHYCCNRCPWRSGRT